jgi:hypothetical protein
MTQKQDLRATVASTVNHSSLLSQEQKGHAIDHEMRSGSCQQLLPQGSHHPSSVLRYSGFSRLKPMASSAGLTASQEPKKTTAERAWLLQAQMLHAG